MGATGAERRRLFFALWPDAALRSTITQAAAAVASREQVGGRKVPAERIHLTLLFLGDVDAGDEARLHAAAASVRAQAFDLALDQVGCFHRSRVLWVGARRAPAPLTGLWLALRDAVHAAGVAHDRKALAPHVTCYRDIGRPVKPVAIEPIAWPVREFVLVHSLLGARAAGVIDKDNRPPALAHGATEYRVLERWPLAPDVKADAG